MWYIVVVGMLTVVGLESPVQQLLRRMRAASPAWTSCQLIAASSELAADRRVASVLAPRLVEAWNAHRPQPPIDIAGVQAIFAAKQAAIHSIDVVYHSTIRQRGSASSATESSWWTHWRESDEMVQRDVAYEQSGLMPGTADPTAMTWRRSQGRTRFSRAGGPLRAVDAAGASMLGVEDSWLGAGSCLGRRARGTSHAVEHDLTSLLARLPRDVAVVESALSLVSGRPTVVLRLGWQDVCWIYLDPARGFSPLRIDRVLRSEGHIMLSRTDLSDFNQVSSGLWLPWRIRQRKYQIESNCFGPGDDPPGKWTLELDLRAETIRINAPILWVGVNPGDWVP
jgi:hypothetical protein